MGASRIDCARLGAQGSAVWARGSEARKGGRSRARPSTRLGTTLSSSKGRRLESTSADDVNQQKDDRNHEQHVDALQGTVGASVPFVQPRGPSLRPTVFVDYQVRSPRRQDL